MVSPFVSGNSSSLSRIVVDVGNTRLKWGRCDAACIIADASLPPDEPSSWHAQLQSWSVGRVEWSISGVHPQRRDSFRKWAQQRGDAVGLVSSFDQLPLKVAVDNPSQVGIDRLLNAVAANTRRNLHAPAIMVDAGTAITVDYVDEAGVFRGGAIMPGLTLMAKSLHDYTALLPLVPVDPGVSLPGGSTVTAMQAGIFWSVAGGILELIARLKALQPHSPAQVFLTGGDAMSLRAPLPGEITVWPTMTLEGLRIASWAGEDR